MSMKTKYLSFILLIGTFFSCSEKEMSPISNSLGKPGVVTDVVAKSSPGGALISYKIPDTEDLLAVKGMYVLSTGKQCEVIASYYENKLNIQGYNDMEEHTVTLYAVNRAGEKSDPVMVSFIPEESPLNKAAKTASIEPDFGGARFLWKNSEKAPLNIELLGPDSEGKVSTLNILTSNIENNTYSVRGFTSDLATFSMVISDNFGNYSDTISAELIPLFEEKLNKKKMRIMHLDSDADFSMYGCNEANLLDDDPETYVHTANNVMPAAFTVDLGTMAKLSRFVIHPRNIFNYYAHGNPKKMEVYTCDHTPNPNGDWSEWTKIMDCEVVKPSGLPGQTVTDLDLETAKKGFEFSFDLEQPPMRYVRVLITSAWDATSYTSPAEVTFYGEIVE